MKELSLHIERLLLHHDCVVVPHFGAFVVRDSAASRSEQENLFFPPSRLVRFNPDVVQDDNLLVGAIRDERQCSVTDAKRAVQGMVLNLRQQLLADSQVDFGTIGVFMQDEDGELSFSSCQAGVTTPRYYGLDVFTMPRLAAQQPAQHTPHHRGARIRNIRHNDDITIHISRRALRNIVAAAAIAILCVLFTTPFELGDIASQQQQATVVPSVPTTVAPTEQVVEQQQPTVEKPAPVEAIEAAPAETVPVEVAPPANNYCVVLASSVSRKNAEAFVERLHKAGYAEARIHDNGRMIRVIVDGMTTEIEAANLAHEMHALGGEYAQAWVMKL